MKANPNRVAAIALVNTGFRIFACNVDKKPTVKVWEQAAECSPGKADLIWTTSPELLPAIPVGAHGLVVIDADCKLGAPNGVEAFNALCTAHRIDLNEALIVETPSGGRHYYFRTETPYSNSRGSLPDGIDVRGVGGYTIAPGAKLPDGRAYRIIAGSWETITALPDALGALLRPKQAPVTLEAHQTVSDVAVTDRERAFAEAALADEVAKLSSMREGSGRNRALNEAAHSLGTMAGWIDLNSVMAALLSASVANGYIAKDGEAQAKATIESGINAGRLKPRPLLPSIDTGNARLSVAMWIESFKRRQPKAITVGKRIVTLIQGSQIEAQSITWLWDGYLPSGKLTLLAGAGGTGKSTIAFNLAATITNGGIWPDGSQCNCYGNVLIWSSEDDPSDTIKPRMMAVRADDSRYGIISGVVDEHGLRCPFDAARDMQALREAVSSIGGIKLLIIDPIVTAVTGDMHKANDVRRSLQAIVDFASEANCAVLGITHFAKGTAGKNSAERVIGSQAFAALARMVLVVSKDEESDKRVFTRAKSNNSVDTGGFSYSIQAMTLYRGIVATRVVWGEALEGSSRAILNEIEGDATGEGASKVEAAKSFLRDILKNGFVPSKELFDIAREAHGIKPDTLRRAGRSLAIEPRKLALDGGWVWELPISIKPRSR